MTSPDVCLYHAPCADGFTAAWAIRRRWPDATFIGVTHGDAPPDVTGKHVLIVDFSYKKPVLLEMARSASSIVILDHHKSAREDLADFMVPTMAAILDPSGVQFEAPPIQAYFDMDKSGARLAWEYARPRPLDALTDQDYIPWLVRYVEDRDLWRFKLEHSRAISSNIFSFAYDFDTWDAIAFDLEDEHRFDLFVAAGEAIERKHQKDIAELLKTTERTMVIGGKRVPVANLPYTLASDAANLLARRDGAPFGATYFDNTQGARIFSLRSIDEKDDVSAVAVAFGGGGHRNAAGFKAAPGWEGEAA